MKKRLRFIFLVAGTVATMIVACQLYWIFYNYKITKANFIATANYVLRSSVEEYELKSVKLPTSLQYARPTLTFMTRTIPSQDPIALDTPNSKRRFSAEFSTVAVDSAYLKQIKTLVARLKSQQERRHLDIDSLDQIFQAELIRSHIKEKFKLSVHRGKHSSANIFFLINYYKDPVVVEATLVNPMSTLITRNLGPVVVSTILILLSVTGLIYMGKITLRQAQLDKMKDEFINNISHELKTPLSILRTSNEALLNFGAAENGESLVRYLSINARVIDELDSNIDHMVQLTLSDLSKNQPVYENINLSELVQNVAGRFTLNSNIDIKFDADNATAAVFTDTHMMGIILNNLIDNAIKYSETHARISIRFRHIRDRWQLIVSDKGRGISADHIPYIFDKFYRVPLGDVHEVKGYGIGLAHVFELVKKLNGKVTVESRQGYGTTFYLTFK